MPLDTIKETMDRAVSEDSEYTTDRKLTNQQILIQKLKLIGLNIAKVMMDIKEENENYKLMYDDAKLLQMLGEDLNDCTVFMNVEILNKR